MASIGRVLVVDEQPHIARLVCEALRGFGYRVKLAVSMAEALGLLTVYQPDVAILGLWTPGSTGPAVREEFRRRDPALPIIALSASRDLDVARAVLASAFDYISTPIDLGVLERVVAAAIVERDRTSRLEYR